MTEIELLLAERSIRNVLHLYCRAIDRLDKPALGEVYHPGASDDHGSYRGSAEGFIDYVLERLPRVYAATQHSLSNISIDVRGETARVESYVQADHLLSHVGDVQEIYRFVGRYIDRFEMREGSWRIANRKLLRTWDGYLTVTRGSLGTSAESPHTDGVRSRNDPSYQ